MKVFSKKIMILLMVFAATISSCSSDDDNSNGAGVTNGSLTAKVNGSDFRSLPEEAEASVTIVEGQKFMTFAGRDESGRELGVTIENFTGVGTYNLLDPEADVGMGMYMEGEGDDTQIWMLPVENGEIGKLVVTEYKENGRIKGTFYFEVWNPFNQSVKRITDGAFNLRILTVGL